MGSLIEAQGEDRVKEAWEIARRYGATQLYRIEDQWGGYWQISWYGQPYNFRTPPSAPLPTPLQWS